MLGATWFLFRIRDSAPDGSASLLAEGSNPAVVESGKKRGNAIPSPLKNRQNERQVILYAGTIHNTEPLLRSLEIDLFDTVEEIKEKIEKSRGIPACDQTLMFDGQILQDEYAINNYDIAAGSHVKLVAELTPKRISLLVRSPRARAGCLFEVSVDDTVEHLKELVATAESVHPNQLALLPSGSNVELQDHCSIRECGLELQPQVDVLIRPMPRASKQPPPLPPPSLTLGRSDNITVRVLPWEWKQKVVLGVDRSANVRSLRDELEKMQPSLGHGLPPEGYFFIHNQSCMEENQTFMWHGVEHGDTIEVFRGRLIEDPNPPVSKRTPRYRSYED